MHGLPRKVGSSWNGEKKNYSCETPNEFFILTRYYF